MASGTELWKAWQEGLANKDSSKLAELLTDDFEFVTRLNTRSRQQTLDWTCLLYTSPSPRDRQKSRMPSSA